MFCEIICCSLCVHCGSASDENSRHEQPEVMAWMQQKMIVRIQIQSCCRVQTNPPMIDAHMDRSVAVTRFLISSCARVFMENMLL